MVIPRNRPISVAFYDAHGDTEDLLSSYIPGSPGKNCKQCVNESWSKEHHRRYWIWYCFVLSVSFALFCVLAWNLSFKQNWSAFAYNTKYSVPNIIYTNVSWIKNYIYNSLKLILWSFFYFKNKKNLLYVDLTIWTKTCNVTLHPVDKFSFTT